MAHLETEAMPALTESDLVPLDEGVVQHVVFHAYAARASDRRLPPPPPPHRHHHLPHPV